MNFISREEVIAIIDSYAADDLAVGEIKAKVEALFAFPAPNPNWTRNNRNVMGQTEDQFWAAVEDQYPN